MGYWVFYEDESTWSASVGQVCSAIVNYGVELPWCVCATSSTLIQQAIEAITTVTLMAAAAIGADAWWGLEYSLLAFTLAVNLPVAIKQAQGNYGVVASRLFLGLANMASLGSIAVMVSGLQGGVVFGGKLFHPTMAVMAVIFQGVSGVIHMLGREINEYAVGAAKADRTNRVINCFERLIAVESVVCLAIATYGMPKIEQETELMPWLFLLPVFAVIKGINESLAADEAARTGGEKEKKAAEAPAAAAAAPTANGDAGKKKEEEKKPAAAAPAKKTEEKKDAEKKEETPAEEAPAKPKASLVDTVKGCVCGAVCFCKRVAAPVVNVVSAVHARVMSLPWACMSDLLTHVGTLVLFGMAFYTLTEDVVSSVLLPMLSCALPMAIRKSGKLSAEREQVAVDACRFGAWATQYCLFKANIVQAY